MRYCDKKSLESVRRHLASLAVATHPSTLENFLGRVVTVLRADQASARQVDLRLLRAIRRRLGLPLQPPERRGAPRKALPRFSCVGPLAAVRPRGPVKPRREPALPVVARSPGAPRPPLVGQTPPAVISPRALAGATPPGRPSALQQMKDLAEQAQALLPAHVGYWEGGAINWRTKQPISEAELVRDYGLSVHQARAFVAS